MAKGHKQNVTATAKAALAALLTPQGVPSLFEDYTSAAGGGARVQVAVAYEKQCGGAMQNDWHKAQMEALEIHLDTCIKCQDMVRVATGEAAGVRPRSIQPVAGKYKMRQDGSYGSRLKRKAEAERLFRDLMISHDVTPVLQLIDHCDAQGHNVHDMADAFLMALRHAIIALARYRASVRPGLKKDRLAQGWTPPQCAIRTASVDFGTVNFAYCVLELVDVRPSAKQKEMRTWESMEAEGQPIFRILHLALVDLTETGASPMGLVKASYAPGADAAPVWSPRNRDIAQMFAAPPPAAPVKQRKRKRVEEDDDDGNRVVKKAHLIVLSDVDE